MAGKKKSRIPIGSHWFQLVGSRRSYYKGQVNVDFNPMLRTYKNNIFKIHFDIIWPTFNNDGKYYTPTFIIPKFQDQLNDEALKYQLLEKIEQHTQNSEILQAKPRSMSKICGVCLTHYTQYFEHIQSRKHKEMIKSSPFDKHIKDLCEKFDNISNHSCNLNEINQKMTVRQQRSKSCKRSRKFNGQENDEPTINDEQDLKNRANTLLTVISIAKQQVIMPKS